jgi:hypothetical protein
VKVLFNQEMYDTELDVLVWEYVGKRPPNDNWWLSSKHNPSQEIAHQFLEQSTQG